MKRKAEIGEAAQQQYPRHIARMIDTIDELMGVLGKVRAHLVEVYATPNSRVALGELEQRLDARYRTLVKQLGAAHQLQNLGCDRGKIPGRRPNQ
jgi:hypothetical protein